MSQSNKPIVNPPFFYGWIIVFVSSLGVFFSGPGQTYSISIFIDHYITDFEYSRSFVSGLYSTATLCAGFTLFAVGRLIDKFGQRMMMTIIGILLAIACFWNAFITGAVMMFIGIFLLRLLGQGSMTLMPNTLVPQWFQTKRGRALSVMTIGGFASSALFPPLNTWMISQFGWRTSWIILGVLLLVVFVPLAFLFVRNDPMDIGEKLDGKNQSNKVNSARTERMKQIISGKPFLISMGILLLIIVGWTAIQFSWLASLLLIVITVLISLLVVFIRKKNASALVGKSNPNVSENEVSWSLKEAMRTKEFWFILFCVCVPALVNTGVTFHIVSIAEGKGLTPQTAALILSLMAIFGFPVSMVVGYLVDRISVHYILAITFVGHLISLSILLMTNSVWMAMAFGVFWGVVNGFERIVLNIVWPNYFGRKQLGSIKGFVQTCMVLSSALGPLPFGLFFDMFGGYTEVIIVAMLLPLTASILALLSPKPSYQANQG